MNQAASDRKPTDGTELPASAYPYYHRVFGSPADGLATGLLFDTPAFAVMSINHPPSSHTPDLNADKDGDRILILASGDLLLQIGENHFRLEAGDAVRIPRGLRFGNSRSKGGAHLLLIRGKAVRSFSLLR